MIHCKKKQYNNKLLFSLPRLMILEAVFHEVLAKTLRKLTISGRNPVGKCQEFDPTIGSGDRIRSTGILLP
jgi:hypothetical protein